MNKREISEAQFIVGMRDVFLLDATNELGVVTQKPQCGVLKPKCD